MNIPFLSGIIAAAAAVMAGRHETISSAYKPFQFMQRKPAMWTYRRGRASLKHPPKNQRQRRLNRRRAHAAGKRHAFN